MKYAYTTDENGNLVERKVFKHKECGHYASESDWKLHVSFLWDVKNDGNSVEFLNCPNCNSTITKQNGLYRSFSSEMKLGPLTHKEQKDPVTK